MYAKIGVMLQFSVKKRTLITTRLLGFLGLLWLSMAAQACLLAPPFGKSDIPRAECQELAMGQDAQTGKCNPIAHLDCELPEPGPLSYFSIDSHFVAPILPPSINLVSDPHRNSVITAAAYPGTLPIGPPVTLRYGVFLI